MSEKINFNNLNNQIVENETEDGEINESSSAEARTNDDEIEHYYMSVNKLENDLRCNCCNNVFGDPVTLACQHLMDRSCLAGKIIGNSIECSKCHKKTICDDIDQLPTDFNIASRIPPKPKLLLSMINKHKEHRKKKYSSQSKDEYSRANKRGRRSRWSETEDNPQTSVSGAIADILSSNTLPKNITMSQFKKYTEISSKSGIMNLVTKAVIESGQNIKTRNIESYSDTEILEMIPIQELEDLFELEKTQFLILYKDSLSKGVVSSPSPNKMSKAPLLPTPNPKSDSTIMKPLSITGPSKKSSFDSSDSDFSDKSSNQSSTFFDESPIFDSSELLKLKISNFNLNLTKFNKSDVNSQVRNADQINSRNIDADHFAKLPKECVNESMLLQHDMVDGGSAYRENVNRLHSIYSKMYLASLKMKEFENQLHSPEYHSAYNQYSDNYAEYQKLYSAIQTSFNIDSVVTERTDSYKGLVSHTAPIISTNNNKSSAIVNQEQASSTISPNVYAPDSTESLTDHKINEQCTLNSCVTTGLSELQEYKKQTQLEKRKKYGYLWISNLCKDTRAMDLCKLFSNFGHVSKIKLFQYKAQTPMSFFSLIFMPNFNEAENAFKGLQNSTLSNHQIHIRMLESDPLSEDERKA